MERTQPKLPMELMLELIDLLLAAGGGASTKGAARMAQTCATLRSSEAGKRARYLHALALRSLSAPKLLPSNLVDETEVLLSSRWPHQAPPHDVPEGTPGLDLAFEAILRGDECFTLSEDLQSVELLQGNTECNCRQERDVDAAKQRVSCTQRVLHPA